MGRGDYNNHNSSLYINTRVAGLVVWVILNKKKKDRSLEEKKFTGGSYKFMEVETEIEKVEAKKREIAHIKRVEEERKKIKEISV